MEQQQRQQAKAVGTSIKWYLNVNKKRVLKYLLFIINKLSVLMEQEQKAEAA